MNTKALIVKVTITKPGQSETDEELTAEVHSAHGMKEGAGRYTRALYPPDAFNPVKTVESRVRRYFKAEQGKRLILSALGWICPAPHVERHHMKIAELEAEFWPAVEKVKESWPSIIAKCREIQGDRYNPDDYPRQDQVRSQFSFLHIPTPMPNPDTIGDLDFLMEERASQIREQMQANIERAARDGSSQAMNRVLEYVNRIASVLSKPDPTVHDKLIENLREVLDLAPALNLSGDPAINQIVAVCRQKLLVAPEALRGSALQRRIIAGAAKNITAQFGGVGQRRLAAA
jgi:hypothetical protein